ncbi:hypothetical protein [Streptomyces shenzhenensis]|uniref:hypothetical protein n=1 Tax=Streptomyces shenzhenensis TaxID=943815 RepID=UPI0036B01FD5
MSAGGHGRPRALPLRAALFVGRTLRGEWQGVVVDPLRQLRRRGPFALSLAFLAAFGVIFFHDLAQRPTGALVVWRLGGVTADLPLWLALLRTPVSLYVPALDLPVWAGITQLFLAFALAELALGRARTLAVAYATTLAGTLTVRVMIALGPGWWGLGLPPETGQVLDTGPSAAVVGLFTYISVVRRAPVVFFLTGGSMVWESIAVPNLAGREHLIAVAAAIVLGLLHGHRPQWPGTRFRLRRAPARPGTLTTNPDGPAGCGAGPAGSGAGLSGAGAGPAGSGAEPAGSGAGPARAGAEPVGCGAGPTGAVALKAGASGEAGVGGESAGSGAEPAGSGAEPAGSGAAALKTGASGEAGVGGESARSGAEPAGSGAGPARAGAEPARAAALKTDASGEAGAGGEPAGSGAGPAGSGAGPTGAGGEPVGAGAGLAGAGGESVGVAVLKAGASGAAGVGLAGPCAGAGGFVVDGDLYAGREIAPADAPASAGSRGARPRTVDATSMPPAALDSNPPAGSAPVSHPDAPPAVSPTHPPSSPASPAAPAASAEPPGSADSVSDGRCGPILN